ncbi:MAG: hypothetical protein ACI4MB_00745 [Candidatus Coproplasma sp.]
MAHKKNSFHCKSEKQRKAIAASYARRATESKSVSSPFEMHLAKIQNDYMFTSNEPLGVHTYAVYTENNEVRAIPTTHLYVPDKERMDKLHKGLLCKVKFAGYETPSGVENRYYNTNAQGGKIDLQDKRVQIDKSPLPQKQALTIKEFAKFSRKR